jgi:hypothetical protein
MYRDDTVFFELFCEGIGKYLFNKMLGYSSCVFMFVLKKIPRYSFILNYNRGARSHLRGGN